MSFPGASGGRINLRFGQKTDDKSSATGWIDADVTHTKDDGDEILIWDCSKIKSLLKSNTTIGDIDCDFSLEDDVQHYDITFNYPYEPNRQILTIYQPGEGDGSF
mmetsp:Transcript_26961/g.4962  ORF Transcript_26961/g.4962 Transcript_26961/m.4962 type:complete len:105 (+) Transcript_26961:527-841(+)